MAEESTPQEETIEQQPKIKIARWLQIVIGIVFPIFTMFLFQYLGDLALKGQILPWESLGKPPNGATEFMKRDSINGSLSFYVKNSIGEIYQYIENEPGTWILSTEEEVQKIDDKNLFPPRGPEINPPAKAVDRITFYLYSRSEVTQVHYAILSNGSISKWTFSWGLSSEILLFCVGFLGFEFGGLSLIILRLKYLETEKISLGDFLKRMFKKALLLALIYPFGIPSLLLECIFSQPLFYSIDMFF